jgi:integrase
MATLEQRKYHLGLWREALGGTTLRGAIDAGMIRGVLQGWRNDHAPATCNKLRTALMHLWTTLDGKAAANPVRDVKKFRVDKPLPRGRDPHLIDAKLKAAPLCLTRACFRILLWTGMRPVELRRAKPEDVNLKGRTQIVRTAKGGPTRTIGLTPQAVEAWREFEAVDGWERGVPNKQTMCQLVKKWTGLSDLRAYDLRHSYGTALAVRQTRLDVIAALMGHSSLEMTKRYTLAAVTPDAARATLKLAQKPKKLARKAGRLKRTA